MSEIKLSPKDLFREIGIDTECWTDKTYETIFFIRPRMSDDPPGGHKLENVSFEAVKEFVAYWQNQINLAQEYIINGCNPKVHEWVLPPTVVGDSDEHVAAALACAARTFDELPDFPIRVDQMTEREFQISQIVHRLAGAILFIRNQLQEGQR